MSQRTTTSYRRRAEVYGLGGGDESPICSSVDDDFETDFWNENGVAHRNG